MNQFKPWLFILALFYANIYCQNSTTVGKLNTYQTINSIGIEWSVVGDENHNAECTVKYKEAGTAEYKDALPLFRIDFNGFNMMAGSILFLSPATTYNIQLNLSDPDGGNDIRNLEKTTRAVPEISGGNTYYVSPGNGGGSGTEADPFLGFATAQNNANPGDIFLLNSGSYGGRAEFTASGDTNNYIVWKAAPNATPQFDGVRIIGDYIWIEGITIADQDYGLLTNSSEPYGIVIKGNYFKNCHYSIYLNHGGSRWYITDNIIEGDITDFTSGVFDGEGIELWHSDGHVVAFNKISNTADGVSYPGKNCDIFRNEIFNVSDDGIEFDYCYANNRAWENRITTANNNGISFQPTYSAPEYVIRNQVIVLNEDVFKLRDNVDRVLAANNTLVCQSGPVATGSGFLTRFQSNNNLYISVNDRYIWEDGSSSTETDWRTNLDYDGFDWNNNIYAFKWKGDRLGTLGDLQLKYGIEKNGIRIWKDEIFEKYSFPASPDPTPLQYLTLKSGCNAIDAGIALNNINDTFNGSAPDLGAFEFGADLPVYGPRENNVLSVAKNEIPEEFKLYQNYPNPFNPTTSIKYRVPRAYRQAGSNEKAVPIGRQVKLSVYNLLGQEVATLVNEQQSAGNYQVKFDGSGLTSGVYFYKLSTTVPTGRQAGGAGIFTQIKKMILIK